jgi:hypothetical protein
MKRKLTIGFVALVGGAVLATGATGASERAAGTLRISATFAVQWNRGSDCPPGTPAASSCFRFVGKALVPGLGSVTERYTRTFDGDASRGCVETLPGAVIEIAGKGQIEVSMVGRPCEPLPPARPSFVFTITGGSGTYAGATGSVQVESTVAETGGGEGIAADAWTGALTVPGLDFDTVPPAITGAAPKTVKAPKKAKSMRVRYVVMAKDAVDGAVSVACTPRSGSSFKRGRTKVSCSATDSSANTAKAAFTVTVK